MDWLKIEILTGFQKLSCLGLDREPASDMLPGTVMAWIEAITYGRSWDKGRDTPRIREAFLTLARTRRQWPAPADFLDAVPIMRTELKAIPRVVADPDRAKAAIAEAVRVLQS